jgi:hypothetical protein
VPATGAACPATDQRGVPRPSGQQCDIGAYEVAPPRATTGAVTGASLHAATLTATVTPNSGDASVTFQFGTSRKYGSVTQAHQVDGVTAAAVSADVTGLKANVTYHYRVTVSSMDGTATGTDQTFITSSTPVLRSLKLKPARFAAAGPKASPRTGTTITYTDSQVASTRFTVLVRKPGIVRGSRCVTPPKHGAGGHRSCNRYVKVASFTHTDLAAANKLRFSGRVANHKLAPARYELQASARAHGKTGPTVSATFTIVR